MLCVSEFFISYSRSSVSRLAAIPASKSILLNPTHTYVPTNYGFSTGSYYTFTTYTMRLL